MARQGRRLIIRYRGFEPLPPEEKNFSLNNNLDQRFETQILNLLSLDFIPQMGGWTYWMVTILNINLRNVNKSCQYLLYYYFLKNIFLNIYFWNLKQTYSVLSLKWNFSNIFFADKNMFFHIQIFAVNNTTKNRT